MDSFKTFCTISTAFICCFAFLANSSSVATITWINQPKLGEPLLAICRYQPSVMVVWQSGEVVETDNLLTCKKSNKTSKFNCTKHARYSTNATETVSYLDIASFTKYDKYTKCLSVNAKGKISKFGITVKQTGKHQLTAFANCGYAFFDRISCFYDFNETKTIPFSKVQRKFILGDCQNKHFHKTTVLVITVSKEHTLTPEKGFQCDVSLYAKREGTINKNVTSKAPLTPIPLSICRWTLAAWLINLLY